jgi:hypothetical protein
LKRILITLLFTPLEERYNVEMPPSLIVIKEWN